MAIDALLARLETWLIAHRPDYFAQLQPGVSDAALDAFEARFGLQLPDAFRALYRWRNGQPPDCYESLQHNRIFSALDDIAQTKDLLDGMIGSDFEDPAWWRRGWVPFLANGGGSHLCLDTDAEAGGTPGQLIAFWKAEADRPVAHASVQAWLADGVASMEDGTLDVD